jgi:hypothetical protein
MDEFSNIWIEQCEAARGIRDDWGTRKAFQFGVAPTSSALPPLQWTVAGSCLISIRRGRHSPDVNSSSRS